MSRRKLPEPVPEEAGVRFVGVRLKPGDLADAAQPWLATQDVARAEAEAEARAVEEWKQADVERFGITPVMFHSPRWGLLDRAGACVHLDGTAMEAQPDPARLNYFWPALEAWKDDRDRFKGLAYADLTAAERKLAAPGCGDVALSIGLWTRAWFARHTLPAKEQAEEYRISAEEHEIDAEIAEEDGDMDTATRHRREAADYLALAKEYGAYVEPKPEGTDPVALDWDDWNDDPDPIRFLIPGWLPDGVVTLFAAHGGAGKSYLSLFIALCLATGRNPFCPDEQADPEPIERVKVYLYSAEDNMKVMQFRLARYMRLLGIKPGALKGWLKIVDATGCNNVLFTAARDVDARTTARMEWLRQDVAAFGAGLLIFDNASDALDGSEIDRAVVRQFMTAMKSVAPTVLLLAHVDAATSMADPDKAKGYSGSTGWHNSARSRWFMARDAETDRIVLRVPKSNYAKSGTEAEICWDDIRGLFRVLEVRDGRINAMDHRDRLLGLLVQVLDSGKNVSPSPPSRNNVFQALKPLDGFPRGLTSKGVHQELARWLQAGLVRVEQYTKASRNGVAERLAMTDLGRAAGVERPTAAPG